METNKANRSVSVCGYPKARAGNLLEAMGCTNAAADSPRHQIAATFPVSLWAE